MSEIVTNIFNIIEVVAAEIAESNDLTIGEMGDIIIELTNEVAGNTNESGYD